MIPPYAELGAFGLAASALLGLVVGAGDQIQRSAVPLCRPELLDVAAAADEALVDESRAEGRATAPQRGADSGARSRKERRCSGI